MTNSPASTAALIVSCLENEGVTHVFGIPGEENIRLVDAISRSSIQYVLARHEQGASFMAEVYGRLTGRAGVCSATLGPGAINLLLGTADATTNSTPLIALSAQVGMNRSFKESHQGVDLVSMFAPVTKWSALAATPGAVPEMIRKAFKLAQTERPGAVYLAIPEDVEQAPAHGEPLPVNVPRPDEPSRGQVERAAALLRAAASPIVLAGHGAARAGAGPALRRFAELLGIPVATTFHGKGVFPDDHPLALGAVGFMRHDYVNFGFDLADLVIAVGYELQEFDQARSATGCWRPERSLIPNGRVSRHPGRGGPSYITAYIHRMMRLWRRRGSFSLGEDWAFARGGLSDGASCARKPASPPSRPGVGSDRWGRGCDRWFLGCDAARYCRFNAGRERRSGPGRRTDRPGPARAGLCARHRGRGG